MRTEKRKLADLEEVYVVRAMTLGGETHLLAASEKRGGACLLFTPPDWRASTVWDGPGGAMSLSPVPGREGALMAIQQFFPIFQSEDAGLYLAWTHADQTRPWDVVRVADLPFVHRLEVVDVAGTPFVVASSLCAGKSFRDDWSKPGAVYVGQVPQDASDAMTLTPVLEGLSKNHGMHVTTIGGVPFVLISAEEGLFSIAIPGTPDGDWQSDRLVDVGVSDMCAADLDGDGENEIVTIEPFHGNRLAVYRCVNETWTAIYETELDFGHVVWAGALAGAPAILTGSRGADKELAMLAVISADPFSVERTVLDVAVGPTQVAVVNQGDRDLILSANHGAGEVALYTLSP